jgi:hypothetical protein
MVMPWCLHWCHRGCTQPLAALALLLEEPQGPLVPLPIQRCGHSCPERSCSSSSPRLAASLKAPSVAAATLAAAFKAPSRYSASVCRG